MLLTWRALPVGVPNGELDLLTATIGRAQRDPIVAVATAGDRASLGLDTRRVPDKKLRELFAGERDAKQAGNVAGAGWPLEKSLFAEVEKLKVGPIARQNRRRPELGHRVEADAIGSPDEHQHGASDSAFGSPLVDPRLGAKRGDRRPHPAMLLQGAKRIGVQLRRTGTPPTTGDHHGGCGEEAPTPRSEGSMLDGHEAMVAGLSCDARLVITSPRR